MITIVHPQAKNGKRIVFDVRLDWLSNQKGVITANDAKGPIYVATPPAFGGGEQEWSPEHLFLGSINSCFMSTYLFFARKMNFEITHFECHVIGQIELVEGGFRFTHIGVFPTVYISDPDLKGVAQAAMEKAQKHCLVSQAVSVEILYNGKIINR